MPVNAGSTAIDDGRGLLFKQLELLLKVEAAHPELVEEIWRAQSWRPSSPASFTIRMLVPQCGLPVRVA